MSKRSAEDLLKVLRSWVGYGRSNGKQKIIIDIYNKDDPTHLPRGYKVQYGDSYCDTTVSAAAIKDFQEDGNLAGRRNYCSESWLSDCV